MFTGIIEEIGTIKAIRKGTESAVLTISAKNIFSDLKLGDSVATNGVCLTVASIDGDCFTADIMNETLSRSSLGGLKTGSRVNLERAMALNGRFGGHIVSGHIDGTGTITRIRREDIAVWYTVKTQPHIMRYIIEKGSITIDGISLTVAKIQQDSFSVSIIPHTANETALTDKSIGSVVNLENDIIGKYIEKFMLSKESTPSEGKLSNGITKEFLLQNNF